MFIYIYIYIYIYICKCVCIYIYICMYIYKLPLSRGQPYSTEVNRCIDASVDPMVSRSIVKRLVP